MVVVGGVTRLTHSGLSIVEWQPIVGTLPPLTDAEWQQTFEKYQLTPEYRQVNHDMTLDGFKGIFWWEYFHRLLGRLIGVVFLVPFLWFIARRGIPPGRCVEARRHLRAGRPAGRDGLVHGEERPRRRPARVAVPPHRAPRPRARDLRGDVLGRAVARASASRDAGLGARSGRLRAWALGVAALVFAMALTGGFVAGIRAGFAYNTFPLMNGHLVPPEILMIEPWWRNFVYNMATVQFVHRAIAWLLAALVPVLWWKLRTADGLPRGRDGAGIC